MLLPESFTLGWKVIISSIYLGFSYYLDSTSHQRPPSDNKSGALPTLRGYTLPMNSPFQYTVRCPSILVPFLLQKSRNEQLPEIQAGGKPRWRP